MTAIVDIASAVLLVAGSFFTVIGALGLLRMPDVYTRMHAASITETLGVGLLVGGMLLQAGFSLVSLKLLILLGLFFFVSPVLTHALAQACLHERVTPTLAEDRRNRSKGDSPATETGATRS